MFSRRKQLTNFPAEILFFAIFMGLILETPVYGNGTYSKIDQISCNFTTSFCGWEDFGASGLKWKISNSTQNNKVPNNGKNFLVIEGTESPLAVSMLISPNFSLSSDIFHLELKVFCFDGEAELSFNVRVHTNNGIHTEVADDIDCTENASWEHETLCTEIELNKKEDIIYQVVLSSEVKKGQIIAIQDLWFRQECGPTTTPMIITGTSSITDDSTIPTSTTDASTETTNPLNSSSQPDLQTQSISTSASDDSLNVSSQHDLENTTTNTTPVFTESSSTKKDTTPPFSTESTVSTKKCSASESTVSTKHTSASESTVSTENISTSESTISKQNSFSVTTGSTLSSADVPYSSTNTLGLNSTLTTESDDLVSTISNSSEKSFTTDSTSSSSQDSGTQTKSSFFQNFSTLSSQENQENYTTNATANDFTLRISTTGSTRRMIVISGDEFLWKTVFISTLTAFFTFSVLSLIVSLLRKVLRRRKQWILSRRSKDTVMANESAEAISLNVFNKT